MNAAPIYHVGTIMEQQTHWQLGADGSRYPITHTMRVWFYSNHTIDYYNNMNTTFARPRQSYPSNWQITGIRS